MYEVDMEIGGSPEGYWAMLRFEDRKRKLHKKEFRKERKADKSANVLQAVLEAFQILRVPCEVHLFTESGHVLDPIKNGWLAKWESRGWKNAEGKPVKNAEVWKRLAIELAWHHTTLHEEGLQEETG